MSQNHDSWGLLIFGRDPLPYSSESMRRKMRVCKICAILQFWEVKSFSSFLALQTSLVCCIIDWIWKYNLSSSFYNKNLSHNFEILAVNACQSRVLKMVFFKKCNGLAGLYGQRMTVLDGLYIGASDLRSGLIS